MSSEGKYTLHTLSPLTTVLYSSNRRPIHERFYFMDGQFRAIEFDSAATTQEVSVACLNIALWSA